MSVNDKGEKLLSTFGLNLCNTCPRRFLNCKIKYRISDRDGIKRMVVMFIHPLESIKEVIGLPCMIDVEGTKRNFMINKRKINDEVEVATDMQVAP